MFFCTRNDSLIAKRDSKDSQHPTGEENHHQRWMQPGTGYGSCGLPSCCFIFNNRRLITVRPSSSSSFSSFFPGRTGQEITTAEIDQGGQYTTPVFFSSKRKSQMACARPILIDLKMHLRERAVTKMNQVSHEQSQVV